MWTTPITRLVPAVLLGLLCWNGPAAAQLSLGVGGSVQRLATHSTAIRLTGPAFDLSVRTSQHSNFIFRVEVLDHSGDLEIDPVDLRLAEVGAQYVPTRGRILQATFGFAVGAYLLAEYDNTFSGPHLSGLARLSFHPEENLGIFVEGVGRAYSGRPSGSALGLTLGVALGVNH
jgi:hypothetical protein